MKSPRAAIRRLQFLGTAVEFRRDRLMIRLPDPRLIRLVARSVLLALAVLSFPWLYAALRRAGTGASGAAESRSVDEDDILLPTLLRDLKVTGLHRPEDRAVVLGVPLQNLISNDGMPESDPSKSFRSPPNDPMAYVRRFDSSRVRGRRLLAVPEAKKEALNGLEDVLLEPPARGRQRRRRTRYLPELMGDTLDGYPRRVFVDVGGAGSAAGWFERHYPRRRREFEIIRVEVVEGAAAAAGGMSEWLARNVREEEYVVVKAEAEVVEEMVKGRALGLVDELFLECKHQWEKQKRKSQVRSRRAYWQCLALYGKLRDEGVAVHQWWG